MSPQRSLLEPTGSSSLTVLARWIEGVLLGDLAVILAIIAVALVGLLLVTGRFAARQAAQVAIGIAIVFGAPTIAAGLLGAADRGASPAPQMASSETEASPRGDLPPGNYNPYAGAALRNDR